MPASLIFNQLEFSGRARWLAPTLTSSAVRYDARKKTTRIEKMATLDCPKLVAKELGKNWITLSKSEQAAIEKMCEAGMKEQAKAIADDIRRQRKEAEIKGHAKDQGIVLTDDELREAIADVADGTVEHEAVAKVKSKRP